MKPIKLKELLRTAKDPATQRIVIDEGLWFDAPLFEGVVKDVDEALGERIISNWQVETDGGRRSWWYPYIPLHGKHRLESYRRDGYTSSFLSDSLHIVVWNSPI